MPDQTYKSQSARDAHSAGMRERYCAYLDESAQGHADYFTRHGDPQKAAEMLTQSLSEALMGNDGA